MQHHAEIEESDVDASPIADEADNSESVLSVPLEVLDHIASFLSDDEDAVKACSLATRQWRLAAKPLLFRSVSLKSARRLREFEAMLCSKSIRGAWVHNLSVTFPSRIKSQGDISAYFSLLPEIISMHLICLRELAFVDLCLPLKPPLPIANIVEAISNLSSIHTLSLTDCGMNEDVLHAMVCSSRNPLNLRLHDVWTRSTNPAELLPKHYPARLTSLQLTCSQDYKFTFGPWFVSSNCWRDLRSLQILIGVYDTLPILGEFIRCIGPALEHLELQLFPWRGIDRWRFIGAIQSIVENIDISNNVNLRTLDVPLAGRLSALFNELPSPNPLTKLVFSAPFDLTEPVIQYRKEVYTALDERLVHPDLDGLSEIYFTFDPSSTTITSIAAELRELLPCVAAKKTMHLIPVQRDVNNPETVFL